MVPSGSLRTADHGELGQQHAHAAAQQTQQQSLGEHLADQAHPARAQGGADSELLLAAEAARDQQVGDIGAGNQKHQAERAEEGIEHRLHRPGQDFLVRKDAERDLVVLIATWECARRWRRVSFCACAIVTPWPQHAHHVGRSDSRGP